MSGGLKGETSGKKMNECVSSLKKKSAFGSNDSMSGPLSQRSLNFDRLLNELWIRMQMTKKNMKIIPRPKHSKGKGKTSLTYKCQPGMLWKWG